MWQRRWERVEAERAPGAVRGARERNRRELVTLRKRKEILRCGALNI